MSQNSPTLLPSRETGASPSCLVKRCISTYTFSLNLLNFSIFCTDFAEYSVKLSNFVPIIETLRQAI